MIAKMNNTIANGSPHDPNASLKDGKIKVSTPNAISKRIAKIKEMIGICLGRS